MEALKASGVCRSYGSQRVLDSFDLTLAKGEFAALMGPSGSGKSTFLHLAAGLLDADSGSIEIGGEDILKMGDAAATKFRRRRIGVVFQTYNLLETLNVEENIALTAKLDSKRVDKERLADLIEKLGLGGCEKKFPSQLSGGERQRVAIARALYSDPEVILADEPTGNLDVEQSKVICALLKELNLKEKCSILLVTHDPVVAAAAGKVHFLKDGRIGESFPVSKGASEISERYLETYR
ncbi:MAG: ABC transporter ATP-binding protein [Kiritimatiellae bacterium]|nr:ABC transporter ATP-binding protein [Kiritimatiellia bacterium]